MSARIALTLPDPKRDHISGSVDGSIRLLEYGDYECPSCGMAQPIVKEIQRQLAGNLQRQNRPRVGTNQRVIVENVNWNKGMGTSIRCAVQHLIDTAPSVEAIALLVCDQPFVDSHTIEQLVALREKRKKAIVASSYAGTLGVPALFHRSCADELLHLDGGSGAKAVISSNHDRVTEFTFPEGKIDIDTAADYDRLHVSED